MRDGEVSQTMWMKSTIIEKLQLDITMLFAVGVQRCMHGCPCPNRTERMVKNETDRCRQAEKESAQMVAK